MNACSFSQNTQTHTNTHTQTYIHTTHRIGKTKKLDILIFFIAYFVQFKRKKKTKNCILTYNNIVGEIQTLQTDLKGRFQNLFFFFFIFDVCFFLTNCNACTQRTIERDAEIAQQQMDLDEQEEEIQFFVDENKLLQGLFGEEVGDMFLNNMCGFV